MLLLPAPARAAGPALVLQLYASAQYTGPEGDMLRAEYACRATFTSPNLTDVGIQTGVSCYADAAYADLQVTPGLVSVAGPMAVNAGAATGYGGTGLRLCVTGVGLYLSGTAPTNIAAGPVCKMAGDWPDLTRLVTDLVPPAT